MTLPAQIRFPTGICSGSHNQRCCRDRSYTEGVAAYYAKGFANIAVYTRSTT